MTSGKQLLLGLDVGTTATKALVFDLQGTVVASASQAYSLTSPQASWVEQDPEDLWDAVVYVTRDVLSQIDHEDRIVALSQSSQGGTTIPVDADGKPVYSAISWMDGRGNREAQRVRDSVGAAYVRTTTGWPLTGALPLQHIAWLRVNQPDAFARARRFLFVNDFITHRLTGIYAMNPADATMTQLFDIADVTWADRLLEIAGIKRDQLSPVTPSGHPIGRLSSEASRALGLSEDVTVVNGAHDQYCAAVGTGVTHPGEMLLSCGTAWVLLAVPESLQSGLSSGMAISCHAVAERWGAIRSLGGIGASLEWLLNQVYSQEEGHDRTALYACMNEQAARVPAGAGGLLFLPLSGGHVTNQMGHGGFLNLTLAHTRGDMARAVMEGIGLELRWAIEEIRANGVAVDALKMVGGAAESRIWPQIVADITNLPVTLPAQRQAAACGAAILAGIGTGHFADAETGYTAFRGTETNLTPNQDTVVHYNHQSEHYRYVYNLLSTIQSA